MQKKWLVGLLVLLLAGVWVTQVLAEDVGNFSRVVNEVDQLKKGKEPDHQINTGHYHRCSVDEG